MNSKSVRPENGRMIRVFRDDYLGDYAQVGRWVEYKNQPVKKNPKSGRLMVTDKYGFEMPDTAAWKECCGWEYVEGAS